MKKQRHSTPILELPKFPKPVRRPKAALADANAMDQEAVRIIAEMKSGWLRLGILIEKMVKTRAFETLGFPSMHSWMTKRLGESISGAYSALRSVRALRGIPEAKLEKIGERNAHTLTRLPDHDIQLRALIELAKMYGLYPRGNQRKCDNGSDGYSPPIVNLVIPSLEGSNTKTQRPADPADLDRSAANALSRVKDVPDATK
jgi:hypothetical protein